MKTLVYAICILVSIVNNSYSKTSSDETGRKVKIQLLPTLVRGPYLQSVTPVSIVIRWRTDEASNSRVSYGTIANALNNVKDDHALVTDHEITLTGLQPQTRYYYSIGSTTLVLQGDNNNYFETAPVTGSTGKYRIGVLGDCGTNIQSQFNVRDKLLNYLGNNYMNAWILLGDNAYANGTDIEYQNKFFNIYNNSFLKKNPLYPCPGNHDYANSATRQNDHNIAYYNIFTLPKQGEAGGIPSGNEAYYSFDYGNIHFLSLDSYGREDNSTRLYDTTGKQVNWIKADLAANANKGWIVAFWHHPPYTKGSHNSDTEDELVKIRENFIRILERNGVDLILCGHSHDYERSKLMKGHYGPENSFDPAVHNLSSSSGKYDGTSNSCPYIKSDEQDKGIVYVVSGSAGQVTSTQAGYPHDALPYADATRAGSMILEVEGNRLDAKWIGADGIIHDQFTMEKNVNQKTTIDLASGNTASLSASYVGNYVWNTGENSRSIDVSPDISTEYIVKDQFGCISDIFNVVVAPMPVKLVSFTGFAGENNFITLNWVTASENNASYFALESSLNGKDFTEVGRVNAAGNSKSNLMYSWIDKTILEPVPETVYYRLKQVDLDGSYTFSRMLAIKPQQSKTPLNVILIPNPSSGNDIKIKLIGADKAQSEITVSDASGKVLYSERVMLTSSPASFLPARLHSGLYIFRIKINEKEFTRKLMVQ